MNPQSTNLLTVHGSTVWFDESTNTLRHSAGPTVPRNLTLESRGGHAVLAAKTASAGTITLDGLRPDGRLGRSPGGAPLALHRRNLPEGLISLEANGMFLCAEADGSVSLTRDQQGPWEVFATLEDADLDWLGHLASRAWFSASNDAVLPEQSIRLAEGFGVQLGQIVVRLTDVLASRPATGDANQVTLQYDGWKVEQLTVWRPLVYMIAFGKQEIFDCLTLALQALRQFGRYEGEVLLFTDRLPEQLARVVPPGMEKQIKLATSPARDILDYTATKFRVCDIAEMARYRPLLYLDVDVICDRPIEGLLRRIHRANRLCVALEHDLLGNHNFYGANLFASDPTARPRHERGFTSGIIGIPHIGVARQTFPSVLNTLYGIARAMGTRQPSDWYDQPTFNYVLNKLDAANVEVLTPHVVTPVDLTVPVNNIPRLGFAHFCGGVGNTVVKLPAMRGYLDLLRQTG
ncbi:MAG: hypothetical protein U1E70_23580 [Acetobacteraceae bacterium]|nr:hypothetical protein [Pseudomonadota bacterium]